MMDVYMLFDENKAVCVSDPTSAECTALIKPSLIVFDICSGFDVISSDPLFYAKNKDVYFAPYEETNSTGSNSAGTHLGSVAGVAMVLLLTVNIN